MRFFISFIVFFVAVIEIMVFAAVAEHIGFFTALLLAFLSAAAGIALLRHQGLQTLAAAGEAARRGRAPSDEVFDGICLALAGVLLLVPGFVTDLAGFFLLVPAGRRFLKSRTRSRGGRGRSPDGGEIIEGEYTRLDDDGG